MRDGKGPSDIERMIQEEIDKGGRPPEAGKEPLDPDEFKETLEQRLSRMRAKEKAEGAPAAEAAPAPAPVEAPAMKERAPKTVRGDAASTYDAVRRLAEEVGERSGDAKKAFSQVLDAQKGSLKKKLVDMALDEMGVDEASRAGLRQDLLGQEFWTQMDTLLSTPQQGEVAVDKLLERIKTRAAGIKGREAGRAGYEAAAAKEAAPADIAGAYDSLRAAKESMPPAEYAAAKERLKDEIITHAVGEEAGELRDQLKDQEIWKLLDTLLSGPQKGDVAVAKLAEKVRQRAENIKRSRGRKAA
jgi:hypothetical protein